MDLHDLFAGGECEVLLRDLQGGRTEGYHLGVYPYHIHIHIQYTFNIHYL